MFKIALLSTTLYLTPTVNESGLFGLKYTQKVSDAFYFKVRILNQDFSSDESNVKLRVYFDYNF